MRWQRLAGMSWNSRKALGKKLTESKALQWPFAARAPGFRIAEQNAVEAVNSPPDWSLPVNVIVVSNRVARAKVDEPVAGGLAAALLPLIADTPARRRQTEAFAKLDAIMGVGKMAPSGQAAAIALDLARRGRPALVKATA